MFDGACAQARSLSVQRAAVANLPTRFGDFSVAGYRSLTTPDEYVAVVKGDVRGDEAVLVDIHSQCLLGDVFRSVRCDCQAQLAKSMTRIEEEGSGVIVYKQPAAGRGTLSKIALYALNDEGLSVAPKLNRLDLEAGAVVYLQCAEILFDLGVREVRMMSNHPFRILALEKFGLKVTEIVAARSVLWTGCS